MAAAFDASIVLAEPRVLSADAPRHLPAAKVGRSLPLGIPCREPAAIKALSQATLVKLARPVRGYALHGRADGCVLSVQYGLREAVRRPSAAAPAAWPG